MLERTASLTQECPLQLRRASTCRTCRLGRRRRRTCPTPGATSPSVPAAPRPRAGTRSPCRTTVLLLIAVPRMIPACACSTDQHGKRRDGRRFQALELPPSIPSILSPARTTAHVRWASWPRRLAGTRGSRVASRHAPCGLTCRSFMAVVAPAGPVPEERGWRRKLEPLMLPPAGEAAAALVCRVNQQVMRHLEGWRLTAALHRPCMLTRMHA